MNRPRDLPRARERMVQEEVIAKGIRDPLVIQAMMTVPRHLFVSEALAGEKHSSWRWPTRIG